MTSLNEMASYGSFCPSIRREVLLPRHDISSEMTILIIDK